MSGAVILVALIATFSWGIETYLGATVSRRLAAVPSVISMQTIGFVFLLPVALLSGGSLSERALAWGAVAGVCGVFGWVLQYAASAVGQMGVTQKMTAGTTAIFPFVIGVILGTRPTLLATAGLLVLVAGLLFLTTRPSLAKSRPANFHPGRAALFGLTAGIGLGGALVALGHTHTTDGLYPFLIYRFVVAATLIAYARFRRTPVLPPKVLLKPLAAAALFSSIGDVAVLWALHHGSYLLVPAITSLYPAITALLAWRFAKERLLPAQIAAMSLGFVGLILLRLA